MNQEIKKLKLLIDTKHITISEVVLYEESLDEEDLVFLEINIDDKKMSFKGESFFSVLQDLRRELEKRNIQIFCNGAARNVYPSPMQMAMGSGRIAYKLYMKQPARGADVVDIFDCDESLVFVGVEEQSKYYEEWLKSIME